MSKLTEKIIVLTGAGGQLGTNFSKKIAENDGIVIATDINENSLNLLSDIFLKTLGHSAYVFSFFLILNGVRIISGKNLKWYSWLLLPYLLTLVCFFSSLAHQLTGHFLFDGGFLGQAVHFYFDTSLLSTFFCVITLFCCRHNVRRFARGYCVFVSNLNTVISC